jgi:AcrR family transcriptional regulator
MNYHSFMNKNSDSDSSAGEKVQRMARRKARTRADLLAAARQVFAARGYHEASIAEITETADVGVGTFYLHFRDKDEIFQTLLEEGLRDIREHVAAGAMELPIEQILSASIRLTLHYAYHRRDIFRIALTGGGLRMRGIRARVPLIEGFTRILVAAEERGLLENYDPALLARMITGVVSETIEWWFEHDEPGPDAMADEVLRLLRSGMPAALLNEKDTSS